MPIPMEALRHFWQKLVKCPALSNRKILTFPLMAELMTYALIDSGEGWRLERFGEVTLARPCAHAVWPRQSPSSWEEADATFSRKGKEEWSYRHAVPERWVVNHGSLRFVTRLTPFGHLGLFPEHAQLWQRLLSSATTWQKTNSRPLRLLNLFGYTGGASLAFARIGAEVCHVDASQPAIQWARENSIENGLSGSPIRWIVDDVMKFLGRESRRNRRYDAILLDPPTFGRGTNGELFKIERDVNELLALCVSLLSTTPSFIGFTSHTPFFSPTVLHHLLYSALGRLKGSYSCKSFSSGEMVIRACPPDGFALPLGAYAFWTAEPLIPALK